MEIQLITDYLKINLNGSEISQMFENIRGNKNNARGAVVSLDSLSENVKFGFISQEGKALSTVSSDYTPRTFDQEFYNDLAGVLKQQTKTSGADLQKASLVLPDQLFLLDMVSVPVIHRKAMQNSLNLAIENIYGNTGDLNLKTFAIRQTKQTTTYGLVGIRRDLLGEVRRVFSENGVAVGEITFASNAMVNGAMALNGKIRNGSFLLLDIKENYSRFAFVVRGCTMGYYDLPFGYGMLYESRVAAEDTLFDYRAGRLLVLNAKERALAKQLTVDGNSSQQSDSVYDSADELGRAGRKLPKFMLRPTPQSEYEYVYENFRIFVKWALELIAGNSEIVSLAKTDTVYVNMPDAYRGVLEAVNKSKDEHGVIFAPLLTEGTDPVLAENLELYGAFFLNRFNGANTF